MNELDGLWNQLGSINPSLTSLQLNFKDSCKRLHTIDIKLPNLYPKIAPICYIEAPEEVNFEWKENFNLKNILSQFSDAVEKYNPLWEQLDDLDSNTWILEPDKPSYAISMRRISLENHCSISIEIVSSFSRKKKVKY